MLYEVITEARHGPDGQRTTLNGQRRNFAALYVPSFRSTGVSTVAATPSRLCMTGLVVVYCT